MNMVALDCQQTTMSMSACNIISDKCRSDYHGGSLGSTNNNDDRSTRIQTISKGNYGCKHVTFKQSVRARFVTPISAYSKREIQECWYTPEELVAIRRDVARVVKKYHRIVEMRRDKVQQEEGRRLQASARSDADDDDGVGRSYYYLFHADGYKGGIRGIERKTKDGKAMRAKNWADASIVLCSEQETQWELGIHDPEHLAEVYRNACRESRQDALRMGLLDALEAKRIASSDDEQHSSQTSTLPTSLAAIGAATVKTEACIESDDQSSVSVSLANTAGTIDADAEHGRRGLR
jgi:hypothetical protein